MCISVVYWFNYTKKFIPQLYDALIQLLSGREFEFIESTFNQIFLIVLNLFISSILNDKTLKLSEDVKNKIKETMGGDEFYVTA